ncbi:MAG: hypothetical protein K8U57_09815 [Planctomycetes bacterium]|nr:hypothetical protein [Planctomycetota bacterium]
MGSGTLARLWSCLEKKPAARYSSVAAFAADLRRRLDGIPLSIGQADVLDQHARSPVCVG